MIKKPRVVRGTPNIASPSGACWDYQKPIGGNYNTHGITSKRKDGEVEGRHFQFHTSIFPPLARKASQGIAVATRTRQTGQASSIA
jgi:hypothetical protein